jgi:hypothetical protein
MTEALLLTIVIFMDHGSAGTPWYSDANWLKHVVREWVVKQIGMKGE